MAGITYKSYLMKEHDSNSGQYEKLIDITGYPQLYGKPNMVDITTLSDSMEKAIPGILAGGDLEFDSLYTKEDFTKLKALEGKEKNYAMFFGASGSVGSLTPDGNEGKFKFKGILTVGLEGGGVNEARKIKIYIAKTSEVIFE